MYHAQRLLPTAHSCVATASVQGDVLPLSEILTSYVAYRYVFVYMCTIHTYRMLFILHVLRVSLFPYLAHAYVEACKDVTVRIEKRLCAGMLVRSGADIRTPERCTHVHTCTHTHTRARARTHTHARTPVHNVPVHFSVYRKLSTRVG